MTILTKRTQHDYVKQFNMYQEIAKNADHIDIKSAVGTVTMNQSLAGMFNYQPEWVTFLYRVRWIFVRLLGMKQDGIPHPLKFDPDTLDLKAGDKLGFFDVDAADSDISLFVSAKESHLKATLGVVREPLDDGTSRFYVITIVHYKSWAGPIYFNVIRPFHHLVVTQMLQAGIRS
jgi:hypothetical protein